MRRIVMVAALAGAAVLAVRVLGPKLHERLMARCEGMFEQMPEDFPPKRMMRGIEEIRADTARTLELLEERKEAGDETGGEVSSTEVVKEEAEMPPA